MGVRAAYLVQRLMGPLPQKEGDQIPDMSGSIVVYADNETEARKLGEAALPKGQYPGWLRVQETASAIPDDSELKEAQKAAKEGEKEWETMTPAAKLAYLNDPVLRETLTPEERATILADISASGGAGDKSDQGRYVDGAGF